MRVVLDANVIVSALIIGGRLGTLENLWISGALTPMASDDVLTGYRSVCAYPKFGIGPAGSEQMLAVRLLPFLDMIPSHAGPLPAPCRDSDDDIFLRAALGGDADALVSGDQDLLALNGKYPFPILKPADLLRRYFPEDPSL